MTCDGKAPKTVKESISSDVIEIIKRETKAVDFWENYSKQKRLRSSLISQLIRKTKTQNISFEKIKEIAQKLMELAYHIYGR